MAPRSSWLLVFACLLLAKLSQCRPEGGKLLSEFDLDKTGYPIPKPKWFSQLTDHLSNDSGQPTWQQRYYVNHNFYKPGGPVFLLMEGQSIANPIWAVKGQMAEWAKEFNAMVLFLEHRFYGRSQPFSDLKEENLAYLNVQQALGDIEYFRKMMGETYDLDEAKWILFGSGYAGSLVTWFRLKHPELAAGAVASSAIMKAQLDFTSYLEVVSRVMDEINPTCGPAISTAFQQVDQLLAKGQPGYDILTEKFKLCSPLEGGKHKDVELFFSRLIIRFTFVLVFNINNVTFLLPGVKMPNVTIHSLCQVMNENKQSEIDGLAAVNDIILKTRSFNCSHYTYDQFIQEPRNLSHEKSGFRQGLYQQCTQLGWFRTTDSPNQPFGNRIPIKFYTELCQDVFGANYSQDSIQSGIDKLNAEFGGLDINVSNVVFYNGGKDPWHGLGILKNISHEAPAVFVNGSGHQSDMYPSYPEDCPDLVQARLFMKSQVHKWIS